MCLSGSSRWRVVRDLLGDVTNRTIGQKIRAEGARLHQGHLDAQWCEFLRKTLRETLHREFRGGVETRARARREARYGGDVENVSGALLAQER